MKEGKEMKTIYTGTDDFKDLIDRNAYYVDKTKIIEELFTKPSKVTLFPRPRRFGKTLTMSMLNNFFDITKDSAYLFKGLYIEKSEYYKEMNKYPVIFLTFKRLKQDTFDEVEKEYIKIISKLYIEKRYVMEKLIEPEKKLYESIMDRTADISDYKSAVADLTEYLCRYHEKQVIVLIDEYDIPIHNGYINGYYDKIINLIRDVFDGIFKTNTNLYFAVLTGVLRVSKESVLSDPNNIDVYGLINSNYGEYFGFNEEDVVQLFKYYNKELTDDIKNMYDGYNFNGVRMYNPWSILKYLRMNVLTNYWINTSGNVIIKDMIRDTLPENKVIIEKLIQGESTTFKYDDKITYKDLDDHNNLNTILNMMFASGYLTYDKTVETDFGEQVYLKIPNTEVKELLVDIMTELIYGNAASPNITSVTNAINNYDKELLERTLNNMLASKSYFDNEEFYQGFMLCLFTSYLNNNYIVKSNRETGLGRADIMIEKVDRSYGYVLEFKVAKDNEDLESISHTALDQIKDKEYYKELVLDQIKDIRYMCIVFYKNTCIVR